MHYSCVIVGATTLCNNFDDHYMTEQAVGPKSKWPAWYAGRETALLPWLTEWNRQPTVNAVCSGLFQERITIVETIATSQQGCFHYQTPWMKGKGFQRWGRVTWKLWKQTEKYVKEGQYITSRRSLRQQSLWGRFSSWDPKDWTACFSFPLNLSFSTRLTSK